MKTTVRRRGDKSYTYLSLVEAIRVDGKNSHRTLLRLGEVTELRDSGQLDRIITALQTHAEGSWLSSGELEAVGAPAFGSVAAVHSYCSRLGLFSHFASIGKKRKAATLADTIFVLVANRLISPWSKRRTVTEWIEADVALPADVSPPSLDQCYRALDALADVKDATEVHLYERLCDLTNLNLRLCCYDLTSTYFETRRGPDDLFPSRAFGYSRDHRRDRPQVMIGLLVTGDGIPIAHHVFKGNTKDSTTLTEVMADLQERFGVGRIALVADRGLISEHNLQEVDRAGFDHVLATKLHRDPEVADVIEASRGPSASWVPVKDLSSAVCEVRHGGRRFVVVFSPGRYRRDNHRREELLTRTEDKLIALGERVATGRLTDPAKIGAAADRILRDSGVARCFVTHIRQGSFAWDHDHKALSYEEHGLAGRYVLTTSLTEEQASTADVLRHYRALQGVEHRFRIMKDFLSVRPVFHWTEDRVLGHIALCVIAATIEAVMTNDLILARIDDPDRKGQIITPRRALAELHRIRLQTITAGDRTVDLVTRRNALQSELLATFGVDTSSWDKAAIS